MCTVDVFRRSVVLIILFVVVDFYDWWRNHQTPTPRSGRLTISPRVTTNESSSSLLEVEPVFMYLLYENRTIQVVSPSEHDSGTCPLAQSPCDRIPRMDILLTNGSGERRLCTGSDLFEEKAPGKWYFDGRKGVAEDLTQSVAHDSILRHHPMVYVPSSNCYRKQLLASDTIDHLRNRGGPVVFVGDSHMRDIFCGVLRLLGWSDEVSKLMKSKHNHFQTQRKDVHLVFVFFPNKIDRNMRAFLSSIVNATDVIFTNGVWGVADNTHIKQAFINYITHAKSIVSALSSQSLFPLHVTHMPTRNSFSYNVTVNQAYTSGLWVYCHTPERTNVHRTLQRCAFAHAMRGLGLPYATIDFGEGLAVSALARALVLSDGHHHGPVVNDAFAEVFIERLLLRADKQHNDTLPSLESQCGIEEGQQLLCVSTNKHCQCPVPGHLESPIPPCPGLNSLKRKIFAFERQFRRLLATNSSTKMVKRELEHLFFIEYGNAVKPHTKLCVSESTLLRGK
eukprot:PhM_4_TR5905/c0_g1_i1/m.7657